MNTSISSGRFRLGWILIAISVVFGLFAFVARWRYENALRDVQLTVDYEDTRVLADAYQIPHAELLKQLKSRGITSVGLYEQPLFGLRDNARIALTIREEAEKLFPSPKWKRYPAAYRFLITAPPQSQALLQQILTRLREQSQPSLPPRVLATGANQIGILIPASRQLTTDSLMGFDPAQLKAVKAAGLSVTARMTNTLNLNKARALQLLRDTSETGARVVLFSEDEVLGYDTLYKEVGDEMKKRGLLFGNIEFSKQRGWNDFASQTDGMVVRVHSVGIDEAAKGKPDLLIDRYGRAIRERNVRVAYIRLLRQFKGEPKTGESALQQNLDFIAGITREVRLERTPAWLRPALVTGNAQAFGPYPYAASTQGAQNPALMHRAMLKQAALRFMYGLGAVGAVLLLINLFFDLTPGARARWFFLGLFLNACLTLIPGLIGKGQTIGVELLGLVVGVTFSIVGLLWGGMPKLWDNYGEEQFAPTRAVPKVGAVFVQALGILIVTTLITLMGAVLIVALMNDWKFLSHTDEFFGEKATLLAPLLVIGLAFSGSVFPHRVIEEGAAAARNRARQRFLSVLSEPFTVKIALALGVLAVAGMLFIARSGNDSGIEVSSFEWYTRAFLEQVFWTRPRTKEMFVGMPAMIFVVWFSLRRQWVPALLAVAAVTIGQADIINTFCHFWTPLFYSLLRTIHAVWLGAILGLVALLAYLFIERRFFGKLRPITLPQRPPHLDEGIDDGALDAAPLVEEPEYSRPSRTVGVATLPPRQSQAAVIVEPDDAPEPLSNAASRLARAAHPSPRDGEIEPTTPGVIRPENRADNRAVTGGLFTPSRPRLPNEAPLEEPPHDHEEN